MATKTETKTETTKRDPEERELENLARETEDAGDALDLLPSTGLLSFYDRLRERITRRVEKRGKLSQSAVEALLLVPDVFILLVRLALDRDVPKKQRALVASSLAYFVLPADFMPELVLGAAGYLDDLILATIILSQAFSGDLEPYAEKHWSGSKKLKRVIRDVLETANSLVGARVYGKVERLLASKGVEIKSS